MVLSGFCLSCLGVADLLSSGATLADSQHVKGARWGASLGVMIALATLMGMFSFLLQPSLQNQGYIVLGSLIVNVYPLMFGLLGAFVLIIAVRVLPWPMAATCVTVIYTILGLLNFVFIPSLMTWLLGVEQQQLLPDAPTVSVVGVVWQYSLLVAAVFVDIAIWWGRRRAWSMKWVLVIVVLIAMCLATLCNTKFVTPKITIHNPSQAVTQQTSSSTEAPPEPTTRAPQSQKSPLILMIVVSLVLGVPGTAIGCWCGTQFSVSMGRQKE
jgi:hypothetical protein